MSATQRTVDDDTVVSLDYSLRLDSGEEIDSSSKDEPLQFIQGQEQIIPGLENALYGMVVGEEKNVTISPEEGYGEYDSENFLMMPRDSFPPDMALVVGERLVVRDSESGQEYPAYIAEVGDESVKLDFNHPLAGETLHFQVKITAIRDATSEELDHGHVHGPGHAH
jgi:FKBP-type peptidyl-prolyl cis-trans isomerase SlyD